MQSGSPPTGAFAKVLMAFHSSLTGVRVWRCNHLIIWNKKDVGVCISVLIPDDRPSHCPLIRISNVEACPRQDDIYTPRHGIPYEYGFTSTRVHRMPTSDYIYAKRVHPSVWSTPYYIYKGKFAAGRYKINPRGRSLLHHRCIKLQSCEVCHHSK